MVKNLYFMSKCIRKAEVKYFIEQSIKVIESLHPPHLLHVGMDVIDVDDDFLHAEGPEHLEELDQSQRQILSKKRALLEVPILIHRRRKDPTQALRARTSRNRIADTQTARLSSSSLGLATTTGGSLGTLPTPSLALAFSETDTFRTVAAAAVGRAQLITTAT